MHVCEELEAAENSALSHIWLKTKLRIDSEILKIDPESLERESGCIDGSICSPTPLDFTKKLTGGYKYLLIFLL